jgi:hypothetical protein
MIYYFVFLILVNSQGSSRGRVVPKEYSDEELDFAVSFNWLAVEAEILQWSHRNVWQVVERLQFYYAWYVSDCNHSNYYS